MAINKDSITQYQWKKFLCLQRQGIINMNDITKGSKLIGVTPEIYKAIIQNYQYLKRKYNK